MPQQRAPQDVAERSEPSASTPKRIDLSVAQVAASALATIVGALLASELGVYGTIIGAAVVSIGATTGGAVFQHLFRRGGEQLRQAVDRAGTGKQPTLPAVESGELSSEWNEPRTVRAKRRWTWKTCLAVSGLVFALAMGPILAFEWATGQPVSATVKGESGSGTSFGGSVEQKPPATPPASTPSSIPSSTPSGTPSQTPSGTPSGTPSSTPSGSPSPTPSPTPSGTPSSTPAAPPSGDATGSTSGDAATPSGTPSP
ncbi:hypothetical protein F4556_002025 [Kitasatospora gansuensis]|uniref:Uncharacterized protein n=1 Tax=Kitasatospora gansuensis TaxID=258050 RepID=A0A7W7S9Q6_9ACTN|nr:hypothetical protein [Kitasatospora gansuensis]MBB4946490.1 hypothetical protein [Kitasatospora gansuensis]